MKDTSEKILKKEEFKSTKNDIHLIISSEIVANEALNERDVDNYGDIEELTENIREHGVKNPLHGYRETDANGKMLFNVTHGFRRARAIAALLKEGVEIKVPCLTRKKSDFSKENIIIEHFTLNSGMPLSTLEKANSIKKLLNYNYTVAQISKALSLTESYINNLLLLASAPMAVKNAVQSKKVAASMVMEVLRENKDLDKVSEIIENVITEAKTNGKEKATKKDLVKTGGSKKASKKEDSKKDVMLIIKELSHKYNMSELDRVNLEKAIKRLK